jgi:hypothetical protein
MFPQDAIAGGELLLRHRKWVYLGCASFEPRWDAFPTEMERRGIRPAASLVLYPNDRDSKWREECAERQRKAWSASVLRTTWNSQSVPVDLPQPAPWETARLALVGLVRDAAKSGICLVLDITTMPRACFIPIVATALRAGDVDSVIAVYCEPLGYRTGTLATEPTAPTVIPPYDWMPSPARSRAPIGWIPVLGFGPSFATTVYESLVDSYDLGGRVFPLVGFPAFDPRFFDRVLTESARVILDSLRREMGLRDQFIYAAADNPFETREVLSRLIGGMGKGLSWVASPMGPKPMGLGTALAALDHEISIMISQARTYHPEYSFGKRRQHAYVLKLDGVRCY